jgi:hypothetical protein
MLSAPARRNHTNERDQEAPPEAERGREPSEQAETPATTVYQPLPCRAAVVAGAPPVELEFRRMCRVGLNDLSAA